MRYVVTSGWVTLAENTGTIQNYSGVPVELSTTPTPNSGIVIGPYESKQYEEMPKHVRALSSIGPAIVNVVPFRESGSGGGGGGDEETVTDEEVEEIFEDNSNAAEPSDEGDETVTPSEINGLFDD